MLDDSIFDLKYTETVPALSKAVVGGNLKEIRMLLSKGRSLQAVDNRGWSPIHYCVAANQGEVLTLILKLRHNLRKHLVNLTTFECLTPLFLAVKYGASLKIVKALLKAGGDPTISPPTKLSPLHLACLKKGNIQLVKLLVKYGAHVNAVEDLSNSLPLHFAISEAKDIEVIDYLSRVSDLTIRNTSDRTPFMESICSNFLEGVNIFLNLDRNLSNSKGYVPPLACAGYLGNLKMVHLLLDFGADVNMRCKAFVPDPEGEAFGIILDIENYLPLHSSLTDPHVFKILLTLTSVQNIQQLPTNYCNFPLFTLIHSTSTTIYEILLQSNLPEELKAINSRDLVNFLTNCSWEGPLLEEKLTICLRYNFHLNPTAVFSQLVQKGAQTNFNNFLPILLKLVQLGPTTQCPPTIKSKVLQILQNITDNMSNSSHHRNLASKTSKLLRSVTPSLKQLTRPVIRNSVLSLAKTNWLSYKTVQKLPLPQLLINYLLFQE